MFTDCPSCERLFRIHAAQLMAADGWVRCGSCGQTFHALERLHDTPLKHAPTLQQADEVALTAPVAGVEPATTGAAWTDPEPVQTLPEHYRPVTEQPAQDTEMAQMLEAAWQPDEALTPRPEATDTEDTPPELPPPAPERLAAPDIETAQTVETVRQPDEALTPRPGATETEDTPPDLPLPEPERLAAPDIESAQTVETVRQPDEALTPQPETAETEAEDTSPELPPIFVDENKKKAGSGARLLWSSLVVVLALSAVAQLSWLNRDELIRSYPALAPWVELICERLQCEPIRFRDVSAIGLLNRQVAQHPRYRNALLANGTMVNNAEFAQPFPEIELLIFATDGQIIARGRFRPDEYLATGVRVAAGMAPGASVHFGLDLAGVVAPQAANFRFRFH